MNDELIETLEETEVNLRFPTKVSQLENDLNYQTDTQVAATVATETSAREAADQALASDIATETTNRESAEQALASDIASEATARTDADEALSARITANTNAITDEVTARQNADTNLQGQIDAITASSDVTDIVGTYAQLQAYDTSTLGDNDIIKVLQDEQHDGETTYYRWSTSTSTFTLIGEEGPYYTKSAADTKFQDKLIPGTNVTIGPDGKTISATDTTYSAGSGLNLNGTTFSVNPSTVQEKLTAGANIQINGTTISATDTTYSDFTGTTGQTAGTSGLVPAPATTDSGKVLGADGTWVTNGADVFTTNEWNALWS